MDRQGKQTGRGGILNVQCISQDEVRVWLRKKFSDLGDSHETIFPRVS